MPTNATKYIQILKGSLFPGDYLSGFQQRILLDPANPDHEDACDAIAAEYAISSTIGFAVTLDDGSTELPIEMMSDSDFSTGKVHIFVKVDTDTSGTEDSRWLRLYFGKDRTTSEDHTTLWSDFGIMYHMSQNPAGSSPQMYNSASGTNIGTTSGSMTSGDLVDGPIGKMVNFDGNDRIQSTTLSYGSAYTYGFIARGATNSETGSTTQPVANGGSSNPDNSWGFSWSHSTSTAKRSAYHQTSGSSFVNAQIPSTLNASQYYDICVTWSGTSLKVYLDGVLQDTESVSTVKSASGGFNVGYRGVNGWSGDLDEVYAISSEKSADWIAWRHKVLFENDETFHVGEVIDEECQNEIKRMYFGSQASPVSQSSLLFGQFSISDGAGSSTDLMSYDSGAATVKSYLEAMAGYYSGDFDVTDESNGFTLEFTGSKAGQDITLTFTGGGDISVYANTISITNLQNGDPGANEQQTLDISGCTTGTFDLTFNSVTDTVSSLDFSGILSALNTILGTGNFSLTDNANGTFTIEFTGELAVQNVDQISISNNTTDGTPTIGTDVTGSPASNQIVQVELVDNPNQGQLFLVFDGGSDSTPGFPWDSTSPPTSTGADWYGEGGPLIWTYSRATYTYNVTVEGYEYEEPLLKIIPIEFVDVQDGGCDALGPTIDITDSLKDDEPSFFPMEITWTVALAATIQDQVDDQLLGSVTTGVQVSGSLNETADELLSHSVTVDSTITHSLGHTDDDLIHATVQAGVEVQASFIDDEPELLHADAALNLLFVSSLEESEPEFIGAESTAGTELAYSIIDDDPSYLEHTVDVSFQIDATLEEDEPELFPVEIDYGVELDASLEEDDPYLFDHDFSISVNVTDVLHDEDDELIQGSVDHGNEVACELLDEEYDDLLESFATIDVTPVQGELEEFEPEFLTHSISIQPEVNLILVDEEPEILGGAIAFGAEIAHSLIDDEESELYKNNQVSVYLPSLTKYVETDGGQVLMGTEPGKFKFNKGSLSTGKGIQSLHLAKVKPSTGTTTQPFRVMTMSHTILAGEFRYEEPGGYLIIENESDIVATLVADESMNAYVDMTLRENQSVTGLLFGTFHQEGVQQ